MGVGRVGSLLLRRRFLRRCLSGLCLRQLFLYQILLHLNPLFLKHKISVELLDCHDIVFSLEIDLSGIGGILQVLLQLRIRNLQILRSLPGVLLRVHGRSLGHHFHGRSFWSRGGVKIGVRRDRSLLIFVGSVFNFCYRSSLWCWSYWSCRSSAWSRCGRSWRRCLSRDWCWSGCWSRSRSRSRSGLARSGCWSWSR